MKHRLRRISPFLAATGLLVIALFFVFSIKSTSAPQTTPTVKSSAANTVSPGKEKAATPGKAPAKDAPKADAADASATPGATGTAAPKLTAEELAEKAAAEAAAAKVGPVAVDQETIGRFETTVKDLTAFQSALGFPSRAPGTQGNKDAAAYVEKQFRSVGLDMAPAQEYEVTAPVTKEATLNVGGDAITVLPLYPNHVLPSSTARTGLNAPLIYAGKGTPAEYNGLIVKNSIVVLDFDSGMNWITAADLGARAVLFLATANDTRGEAERKFTTMPLSVPRFYVPGASVGTLMSSLGLVPGPGAAATTASAGSDNPVRVLTFSTPGSKIPIKLGMTRDQIRNQKKVSGLLKSRVVWERVKVRNIIGTIKGTDAELAKEPGNTLIIDAYYDSMAVTPDFAPGAEAAGNCAALFELARYFKAHPPRYNLMFVANGAHHLALAGARNFVADNLFDKDADGKPSKEELARYRGFIGLDLTSRTGTVGLFAKSWFYNQMTVSMESILLNQFSTLAKEIDEYADNEAKRRGLESSESFYVDGISGIGGRSWRSYLPSMIALDSEVATMAQVPGMSFATANDGRLLQDTPEDTLDKMNLSNLASQTATVSLLLDKAITGNNIKGMPDPSGLTPIFGYAVGRAIYRDVTQGGASLLPETPIPDDALTKEEKLPVERRKAATGSTAVGWLLDRTNFVKTYSGVRGAFVERAVMSKKTGTKPPVAQFIFIGPRVVDSKGKPASVTNEIEAYSINADGHIIYAPDMGSERQNFSPAFATASALAVSDKAANQYTVNASVICFKCRQTTLYDTLDQRYFSVLREMTVLDAQTDATPVQFGFLAPLVGTGVADIEPAGIVFSKPGARFKLIMAAGLLGKRLVLLQTDPRQGEFEGKTKNEGWGIPAFPYTEDPLARVTPGATPLPTNAAAPTAVPPSTTSATATTAKGDTAAGSDTQAPLDDVENDTVVHVAYTTARDLWRLGQLRIGILKGFGINNQRVDTLHGMAGCALSEKKKDPYECPDDLSAPPNGGSLKLADEALANKEYDKFYIESRRAFGLESRAYPDVEATSQDVLKGIIFYLALLLPFSFFVERLFFSSTDIRKQIAWTSIAFLVVFTCIRFVHPAFELALTPFIILLAFIILALTVVVTAFLSSKFETEIKRLKQGVHFADVGRLSAIGAAIGLGIANMRRRPTRTALTCITLILLTFTVLSFTSVTANIVNYARDYSDEGREPSYTGLMVRQADWRPIEECAVYSMVNEFSHRLGAVAPRSWYLSRDQGEALSLRVNEPSTQTRFINAPALLGLTPQEAVIGTPIAKTLVAGKWFDTDRPDVCLLSKWMVTPDEQGDKDASGNALTPLGITLQSAVGSHVQVAGKIFEVVGVFDDEKFDPMHDLDREPFTPVDYQRNQSSATGSGAATDTSGKSGDIQIQTYQHMDSRALLIIPYNTALMVGGTTRSVAVGFGDNADPKKELDDLMQRAALGIFGATRGPSGKLEAKLYSSVEATSYEGFASLLVPILIAALIIANTMLGSVFERTKEISIYSAVGLAPVHVAALFIAEAMVYAVLGSIAGYLIAQVVAKVITFYNLLPGITLNYSSSSAVLSTMIVMATVLASTIYPAWAASRLSQADTAAKWTMSEPFGDVWRFLFPFTVSGSQPVGVTQFLTDFFSTHTDTSVGKFYTDRVIFTALTLREAVAVLNAIPEDMEFDQEGGSRPAPDSQNGQASAGRPAPLLLESISAPPDIEVYRISMRVWLAPFDMGVSQDTDILLIPSAEPGLYELQLKIVRQSGEIAAWKRVNRGFIGDLRKQLLLWRTIPRETQQEYILRGRAQVSGQAVPHEVPGAISSGPAQ